MKVLTMFGGVAAACIFSAPAMADTPMQPPMNSFDSAFYDCGNGTAFQMSYDSETPTAATMTTSNNNKTYELKRVDDPTGVAFAAGPVKFWTDGKTVRVEGAETAMTDCKLKPT